MVINNPLFDDLEHIFVKSREVWESLRGARIFITGGTGFIGRWLLESFAWANRKLGLGAEVVILTRDYESFCAKAPHLIADPSINFHVGDVRNFVFPDGGFSHIIHAATDTSGKLERENPCLMFDTIVHGTRRILDYAVFCQANLLFISSGAIYGKQPFDITHIDEDYVGAPDTLNPMYVYGNGKRTAEHLCSLYAQKYKIKTKIARCFAFVGPHLPLDSRYAIGNFIKDGLNGGPIVISGDGTAFRSYLYAADLAIWLWEILINGESCRPYNVGSDNEITISDLANMVAGEFDPQPRVEILKSQTGEIEAERYVPSVKRAKQELGLEQYIDLADSIKKTIGR